MKESKHNIDYFLADPDFISWVKHPNSNDTIFWEKWLKNYPADKEALYNAKAVLERANFKTSEVSTQRREEILDNIIKGKASPGYRQEKESREALIKLRPWLLGSAAAIFLLLATSPFFWDDSQMPNNENPVVSAHMITRESRKGEKTSFYLPDSTKVILNVESKISYPSEFDPDTRKVVLEGEAYFDVRHNARKPFLVKAGEIVTTVHGTSFNVRAYNDQTSIVISLERGSVSVHSLSNTMTGLSYDMLPGGEINRA
ncbi:MAG TPA: FecR domain-containing protein [Pricia sp.]|nr:FecR domain-containing protein [Pricia sp.]